MNWRKELRDQPLHALTGAAIILPVVLWPGVWTLAWAFFGVAAVREVTEEGNPVTLNRVFNGLLNSKLDLTCWTLSGLALGMLLRWKGFWS